MWHGLQESFVPTIHPPYYFQDLGTSCGSWKVAGAEAEAEADGTVDVG
jgi:hypothetical protein